MWKPRLGWKGALLLVGLATFVAMLATGLWLQAHGGSGPASSAGLAGAPPASTCLAHNVSKTLEASCGGVPSQNSCINVLGTNYCITIPSLSPSAWVSWIWCNLSSAVTSAAQAVYNNSIGAVWNAITSLQSTVSTFLSNLKDSIWNVLVGFFGDILGAVNSGLTSLVNYAYTPIAGAISWFFGAILSGILVTFSTLGNAFAFAGPAAPVLALAVLVAILGALLWLTVQLVRVVLNIAKTTFNLL